MYLESFRNFLSSVTFSGVAKCFPQGLTPGILLFSFIASHFISFIPTENLLLDKACRISAKFSEESCDAMVVRNRSGYTEDQELEVQKIVSEVQIYMTFIKGLLPIICMAFLGSWSDARDRRKPLILVPIFGRITSQIGLMVCYWFPQIPIGYVAFAESVPYSLLGGEYCCLTGIYSYMAVNTVVESRSEGVGTFIAFNILAVIVGKATGGVLFKSVGYIRVYSVSIVMFLLCVLFVLYVLPSECSDPSECSEKNSEDTGVFKYITQGFTMIYNLDKERRNKIFAVILAGTLSNTTFEGESTIVYIFTRKQFNWNEIDYSVYITTMYSLQLVGTYITILLLMKVLKFGDLTVGVIGVCSGMLYSLMSAFSQNNITFYAGLMGSIFIGNTILSVRAMILKIADKNEIGRMNSFFGICNSIAPLSGGTVFNFVYRNTLEGFPGAFYLLTTISYVILFLLFLWMYRMK